VAAPFYEGRELLLSSWQRLANHSFEFILHVGPASSDHEGMTEVAFLDARRLGRIRLCKTPLTEPPISKMGFDPILSMPNLTDFSKGVLKRTCPIKALLLDQSFSAGVGNWVAGEASTRVISFATLVTAPQTKFCTTLESIRRNAVTRSQRGKFRHCINRLDMSAHSRSR
jgi:formamidopyrimidine-DNA glycosylase